MIENNLQIQLPPGFMGNGTIYQAAGRWRAGNYVRFHEGTVRPIGGWQLLPLTGATILGLAQAAVSWQGPDGTPWLAVGTTNGLYVIDENNVVYDITPSAITAAPHNWQLSTYGSNLIAVNTLLGDQDISAINTYFWDTTSTGTAAAIIGSTSLVPRGVYATFTTPELFLVCLRGEDPTGFPARGGIGTAYSEHRVYWPTQETLTDFLATTTNTAGDFDLQTKGRLMAGIGTKGESLILSDIDAWKMIFIGGALVYSFIKAGDNCGVVSKFAHVALDQGVFWMGRGKFFLYDGFVQSIPCEVSDAVFGDFNEQCANTVWAVPNPRYNEITWFYPSAGAQSPDRYVTYNFVENHWVNGQMTRSAGVQQRFTSDVIDAPIPVWFDNTQPYQHEQGFEHDGLAFVESGPVQAGAGDRLMRIQGVLPDDRNIGDVQLRLYTSMSPDDAEKLNGPYSLTSLTSVRLTARQVRLRLEEVSADDWRVGYIRLGVLPVERRGQGAGIPVDQTPVSIEILPDSVTLIDAQHFTFESIIRNKEGQVLDIKPDFWNSSNSSQIPVDTDGTVTALASPATANIQAGLNSPSLLSNIATVTVDADDTPAKIVITPTAMSLIASSTPGALAATIYNKEGLLLPLASIDSWVSDTPAHVTVAAGGGQNLTASASGVALGTANITAQITTGVLTPVISNICLATVTDPFVTHTFTSSGEFNVSTIGSGVVDRVLLVGGGGSGGSVLGTGVGAGGGGAGAVIEVDSVSVSLGNNAVNVGAGGAATVAIDVPGLTVEDGLGGGPSSFQGHTADGGGAGSANGTGGALDSGSNPAGSGGGGRGDGSGGAAGGAGGSGGHSGGAGATNNGGGGGGAGSTGVVISGGSAISNDISGTGAGYGPGGNGSTALAFGGVTVPAVAGEDGADGTGAGGGAATGGITVTDFEGDFVGTAAESGKGGSGVVIIRYKVSTGIVATGGVKVVHS